MSGLEPKPQSPERLRLTSIDKAKYGENGLEITVTFTYDTWCCSGSHEIVDGINCIQKTIAKTKERARYKRIEKYKENSQITLNADSE